MKLTRAKAHVGAKGRHCSDLDLVSLTGFVTAVFKAITFAVHLKDMNMVCQSIEQCAGEPFRTKDLSPFIERQV